jgi:hypothetical protein
MPQIATTDDHAIARSLKVLAPLIKQDIAEADSAGRPHYEAAAAKLIEARDGHFEDNLAGFYRWAVDEFQKSQGTIRSWIVFGAKNNGRFKTKEHHARAPKHKGGLGNKPRIKPLRREWGLPVDELAQRALDDAMRLAREASLSRKQEADADRKLANRLIDIGFKVLVVELHPDKGGSHEAMMRLNRIRAQLKNCVGD